MLITSFMNKKLYFSALKSNFRSFQASSFEVKKSFGKINSTHQLCRSIEIKYFFLFLIFYYFGRDQQLEASRCFMS